MLQHRLVAFRSLGKLLLNTFQKRKAVGFQSGSRCRKCSLACERVHAGDRQVKAKPDPRYAVVTKIMKGKIQDIK